MEEIKVAIVEDNKIINESLANLIATSDGYKCAGKFLSAEDCIQNIAQLDVDVLLMDIKLPGMNGIECVKKIKSMRENINILMLTVHEENDLIFEALCAGAVGYLIKKNTSGKNFGRNSRSPRRRCANECTYRKKGHIFLFNK